MTNNNINMNIFKRFIGSLMDKILIMILFIVTMVVLFRDSMATYCGCFLGLMDSSPLNYTEIERFSNIPISYLKIDITVISIFGFINLAYYYICELILHASLGKYMLGGICLTNEDKVISDSEASNRALFLGIFMAVAIVIRFITGVTYNLILILFFLILDLPVIFSGNSLLDIVTNTKYATRK